jgi:hypothetical protein
MNNSNTQIFSVLLVLMVFSIRVIDYVYTPLYNPDKLEQLIAAQNWAGGDGVSRAHWIQADTLSKVFEPLVQWPPGYSLLAGLLLKLGAPIYLAALLPDLLSLGFLSIFSLLFLSGFTFQSRISAVLIWSIFILNSAVAARLTSVDLIAYTCFFGALTLLILSVKKTYLLNGILAGIFLGCSIWFRYAYIPQVLALLCFGILHQWKYNPSTLKKIWIPASSITLILIGIYFLLFKIGNPGYIDEKSSGFFWKNLSNIHWSFPVDGLVGLEGYSRFITGKSALLNTLLLAFIVLLILGIGISILRKRPRSRFPWPLVLSIIPINVGLLAYLSLTNVPQTWMPGGWTFVQEIRYFAPSWAALSMVLVWYLSYQKSYLLEQLILVPLFFVCISDALIYRRWKYSGVTNWEKPGNHQIPEFNDFQRIADMAKKNGQIPTQIPSDPYTSLTAELAGWTPIHSVHTISSNVCILQYELPEGNQQPNHGIGLEMNLSSGRTIYLSNPPHLWN